MIDLRVNFSWQDTHYCEGSHIECYSSANGQFAFIDLLFDADDVTRPV